MKILLACFFALAVFLPEPADAQVLGRSKIKREDPKKIGVQKEKGAVYMEEILDEDLPVTITLDVNAYTDLTGQRWIGTVSKNQTAVLLAVSEKAYRVRAKAKQGQIAGWISKAAVDGLPEDFDENITKFYERHQMVAELIANGQVALGMTVDEVSQSIGDPNKRSAKIDKNGRKDIFEYVTYDRIPQSTVALDRFGRPIQTTTYIQVETGRITIEFEDNQVASIEESEGTEIPKGGVKIVPAPIYLF